MDVVQRFLEHVKTECKNTGIKLRLKQVRYVVPVKTIRCSGYFDQVTRELVVAKKNPAWLEILVHEFAHLNQWRDDCKAWQNGYSSLGKVDDWLAGKRIKHAKDVLGRVRDLELDNEKRSVKLIEQWELPIDVETYIQKANAYINLYNRLAVTRKWPSIKNTPTGNPAVFEQMPKSFRMNYKTMSKKYVKIFEDANL